MAAIVEISGWLQPDLWDYNVLDLGDVEMPAVEVTRIASVAQDGFDAHRYVCHSLAGTYTETGAHVIEGAPTLDALGVDQLIRPAKILRLGDVGPRGIVQPEALAAAAPPLEPGDALIIDTGWGREWNRPGYVRDAPAFSARALPWLLEQQFSILAVDTPVMECQWCASEGRSEDAGELLRPLYERDMVLLAPVVNLDRISATTGTLITLPLPVIGACAAPCRAAFIAGVDWANDLANPAQPHEQENQ